MKHIYALLILCIACTPASVSRPESDREHDGFVGPVKKVFVVWSPISGSNYPVGSRCRQLTKVYDETGRVLQHSVYPGACGSDEIRDDFHYSQDGSQTAETQVIRAKDSAPPPPPLVSRVPAEQEKGQARTVFKYDPSGKLVEQATVKPSGIVSHKSTYTYDAKRRLIETTGYDGDGQIADQRAYSYSGDERVPSGFTYRAADGKVYERIAYTDYEYNSHGDWVKRKETKDELNRVSVLMTFREIEYYPDGK